MPNQDQGRGSPQPWSDRDEQLWEAYVAIRQNDDASQLERKFLEDEGTGIEFLKRLNLAPGIRFSFWKRIAELLARGKLVQIRKTTAPSNGRNCYEITGLDDFLGERETGEIPALVDLPVSFETVRLSLRELAVGASQAFKALKNLAMWLYLEDSHEHLLLEMACAQQKLDDSSGSIPVLTRADRLAVENVEMETDNLLELPPQKLFEEGYLDRLLPQAPRHRRPVLLLRYSPERSTCQLWGVLRL